MMKKTIALLGGIVLTIGLASCTQEKEEPPIVDDLPLTTFEIVQNAADSLNIPNSDALKKNIFLPKKTKEEVLISWKSSDTKVITPEGYVTRSTTASTTVLLTATLTLGSTVERRNFEVTVEQIPTSIEAQVQESIDDFVLFEDNYVDRDIIILPRTSDMNGVNIEWETSSSSVIDLDGNVYRSSSEQNVKLTANFKKGTVEKKKEFDVTVGSTSDDEPALIDENDSRILNKIYVSSTEEIMAACVSGLKPGDAIIINDGTYKDIFITITDSGTKDNPIFVLAKNPGKVFITGESIVDVFADYVTVANLSFKDGYPKTDRGVVILNGEHIRFTNNQIYQYELKGYDYKWLSLTGKYHSIDRNTFDGKSTGGSLLTVWRDDLSSQYHHIFLNEFKNFEEAGGANGYETIRIGTSTYSQTDSFVLLEKNLFQSVSGEIEIISIKSGRTIVRSNTFIECIGLITCRHGKNNLIEDNVFLCGNINDTGGIRMYDSGHIIRNNYIEAANSSSNTRAGIVIHSGVNEVGTTTTMNLQWIPYNILIQNNTIVDSRQSILFGGKYTYPAEDIYLDGNLIVSPDFAAIRYDKLPVNAVFTNNHMYAPAFLDTSGTVKEIITPEGAGYSSTMIQLEKNASGIKLHESLGAQGLVVQTVSNSGISWKNQ